MEKRTIFCLALFAIMLLTVLPTVLAANGWGGWSGGGYQSPLYYFDNEWVWFTTIFLVFFAIIYFTVNKAFKNNIVSGVLALALSTLIGITTLRSGWIYGYVGDAIGTWIIIVVILIAAGFLIRFTYEGLGVFGVLGALTFFWFLLQGTDPYTFLPYDSSDWIIWAYDWIKTPIGLIILWFVGFFGSRLREEHLPIPRFLRRALTGR